MFWRLVRRVLLVLMLLTVLAVALVFTVGIRTVDDDISQYEFYRGDFHYGREFMPELDALGNFTDAKFTMKRVETGFLEETLALFVQYSAEDYTAQKAAVLAGHDFLDAPKLEHDGALILPDAFVYRGMTLRFVSFQGASSFGMIGTDDASRVIGYFLYEDLSRDVIVSAKDDPDKAMQNLIRRCFAWREFD